MDLQTLVAFLKKHPIGVGCAVLALAFYRGGDLTALETLLEERTSEGDRLKNNLRYSADLEEHLATMNQAVATIEAKAINPGALATNLQFFYRLEQDLELTIIDIRQGVLENEPQTGEYLSVPYIVSVQGTYLQLLDFLQKLEQGERLVQFVSANFSPGRGPAAQRADPYDPLMVLTLDLVLLGRS